MSADRKSPRRHRPIHRSRLIAEVLEPRQLLAVITVNSSGDADGADGGSTLSLRQAIEISNETLAISSLSPTQAALVAGALSSPNTIDFAIPETGSYLLPIEPSTALPAISKPVVIDGYSQPGAHPNTNGLGQVNNAVIPVALDGDEAPSGSNGLEIEAGQTTVRGLVIIGFASGAGIRIDGQTGDLIQGNSIGATPDSPYPEPNGTGILAIADQSTIGGTAASDGNVISGNTGVGILLEAEDDIFVMNPASDLIEGNFIGINSQGEALPNGGAGIDNSGGTSTIGGTATGAGNDISGNSGAGLVFGSGIGGAFENGTTFAAAGLVEGNRIGTDVTGTQAVPNGGAGIDDAGGFSTIGGTAAGAGNVISGNDGDGILVQGSAVTFETIPSTVEASDVIQGNFIGTDATGTMPLPNGGNGIRFTNLTGTSQIGGTVAGSGNIIADNGAAGVAIDPMVPADAPGLELSTPPVLIFENSIVSNSGLGISYGPTAGQDVPPVPVLETVTPAGSGSLIEGTLAGVPSKAYRIEFFANSAPDPSGSGQGQVYLGSAVAVADASGQAPFSFTSASPLGGLSISATETRAPEAGQYSVIVYGTSPFARDLAGYTLAPTPTSATYVALLGPNRVATQGQPITFVAGVASTAAGVPTGQLVFLEDGVVIGSSPLAADGLAAFVTDQLLPGPHAITAMYLGDGSHPASAGSNAVAVEVNNVTAFGGPAVTSDVLSGPNAVTVTFNRGLFMGPAEDVANYKIMGPRRQSIAIVSAVYDPSNASVTLTTARALDPKESYQLTINGQTGERVVDVFGIALNGKAKGKPGHNYSGKIEVKKAPVKKAPVAKVVHSKAAKPKAPVHSSAVKKGR